MDKYPRIEDLRAPACRHLPPFVRAYLASGTGRGSAVRRNERALSEIELVPRFLRGRVTPTLCQTLFGQTYDLPFAISPIGLQSLIWPRAEIHLARAARKANIPYSLSTVAGEDIETIGKICGNKGWFQLYPPRDRGIMRDILARAKASGFSVLIVTADVPTAARREDMRKAGAPIGSRNPMSLTPSIFWQCFTHPKWSLATLANGGKFSFKILESYYKGGAHKGGGHKGDSHKGDSHKTGGHKGDGTTIADFIASQINGSLDWSYLDEIRQAWSGPLLLKGVLHSDDAQRAIDAGVDGLIISNHGGRQLDAAPATIDRLPIFRERLGDNVPLLFDSGVRSGLDIARVLASGADFVMLGRAFMYGLACLGSHGGGHVIDILREELENVMIQLGIDEVSSLRGMRA